MVVAGVGAMGLLGWVFDPESLKTFFTGAVSLKANAAGRDLVRRRLAGL